MDLKDITPTGWILALFKRDDGKRLLLGDGDFEFNERLQHFAPNRYENDVVQLQGTDGQILAGQVRRSSSQSFDGIVGDASYTRAEVETARRQFFLFFRKQHSYTVVYIFPNGTAIKRQRGYITDAPSIPELYQITPSFHVALAFGDVNYYSYEEDNDGNEIYSFSANLSLSNIQGGGLKWDANGAMADADGYIWEASTGGGPSYITVDGIDDAQPVWHVLGPATNPTLTNSSNGLSITFNATVPSGQELIVDMGEQTATLEGANVFEYISGSWLTLAPGTNRIAYTAANTTNGSVIYWNEIVG